MFLSIQMWLSLQRVVHVWYVQASRQYVNAVNSVVEGYNIRASERRRHSTDGERHLNNQTEFAACVPINLHVWFSQLNCVCKSWTQANYRHFRFFRILLCKRRWGAELQSAMRRANLRNCWQVQHSFIHSKYFYFFMNCPPFGWIEI